jgi:urease accessory protein UreE
MLAPTARKPCSLQEQSGMPWRAVCRYEEDVDERLDASVKRILQQNRRTAQELQLHMDESSLLLKENQILLEERDKLLQVVSLECMKPEVSTLGTSKTCNAWELLELHM